MQNYSFETDIEVPRNTRTSNRTAYAMMNFLDKYYNKFSIKSIASGGAMKDSNSNLYVPLYISCSK